MKIPKNKKKMLLHYSGEGDRLSDPEVYLKELSCVMLTYYKSRKTPQTRFKLLWKARKRKHK